MPEAALPYNKITNNQVYNNNVDILKLEGYRVDNFSMITFPVLGKISVDGLKENDIELKLPLTFRWKPFNEFTVKVKIKF